MTNPFTSLEPACVWEYFAAICSIPHGSGNESLLANEIEKMAKSRGRDVARDQVGNVRIRIPATSGLEDAPTVVLQGHLDMVCEKNADKIFDFKSDPIVPIRDGEWITADGTTLGADNGIGVALALATMDPLPSFHHGPLEILLTLDEETGLHGALGLQPDFLQGNILLNLDSEETGTFYVGCAGGRDTSISFGVTKEDPSDTCRLLRVTGLAGGHSGLDILENRGNAIKLLARTIDALQREFEIGVENLRGGDKHNAIPREAEAIIGFESSQLFEIKKIINQCQMDYQTEFSPVEPRLALSFEEVQQPASMLTGDASRELIQLLLALPHGVISMSRELKGLVESSSNLARVKMKGDTFEILTSSRSSVQPALDAIVSQIVAVGELAGGEVISNEGYPGWQPNMASPLLRIAEKLYKERETSAPTFTSIHAGLECGIIGKTYPHMDMISFGPTIKGAHSPDERVSIDGVQRCFNFLLAYLERISKELE